MRNFETTLLISPDIASQNIKEIDEIFEKMLVDKGGSIVGKEDWGLRDLSYQIKKFKKAFYKYYQITIEGDKIPELKKNLSQNEKILRYLFIKVNKQEELPTKLSKKNNE